MSSRDQGQRPTAFRLSSSMATMATCWPAGMGAPEPELEIVELEFEKLAEGGTPDEQGAHQQGDADDPADDGRLNESGQATYHGWNLGASRSWAGVPPRPALRIKAAPSLKVWPGGPGPQGTAAIIRGYEGEVNIFRRPVENIGATGEERSKIPC